MTNKTIEDVRCYLAEEVMGWEWGYAPDGTKIWESDKSTISNEYTYNNWKPDQNLSQAFEVLEEYCDSHEDNVSWSHGSNRKYWTSIINHDEPTDINGRYNKEKEFQGRDNKQEFSILGAILKAENKTELLEVLENNGLE